MDPKTVHVFPSWGTYRRLPFREQGTDALSFKQADCTGESGEPVRLLFFRPSEGSKRAPGVYDL